MSIDGDKAASKARHSGASDTPHHLPHPGEVRLFFGADGHLLQSEHTKGPGGILRMNGGSAVIHVQERAPGNIPVAISLFGGQQI
jgi:hypothetical protein